MDDNTLCQHQFLDHPEQKYTLEDLESWDDGNKYELVHGQAFMMGGAGWDHGQTIGRLSEFISNELKAQGRKCKYDSSSSTEVVLPRSEENPNKSTVVYIPDVLILCDKSKLKQGKIFGGPEFVAEVLSDSTGGRDVGIKRADYLLAGVKEYWILDYKSRTVMKFSAGKDEFKIYEIGKTIRLDTLNLDIKVEGLFS